MYKVLGGRWGLIKGAPARNRSATVGAHESREQRRNSSGRKYGTFFGADEKCKGQRGWYLKKITRDEITDTDAHKHKHTDTPRTVTHPWRGGKCGSFVDSRISARKYREEF